MFSHSNTSVGISNVVGTILLLVITILMATILTQFVFGLEDLLKEPTQAGVSITDSFDESEGTYDVRITVNNLYNSEEIIVRPEPPEGTSQPVIGATMSETGESVLRQYPEGTYITIIASTEDSESVVTTHIVGK